MSAKSAQASRNRNEGDTFSERHYTVQQVSDLWAWSPDSVRRVFLSEPGVLILDTGDARKRRSRIHYRTLRIPESVLSRVHQRMVNR